MGGISEALAASAEAAGAAIRTDAEVPRSTSPAGAPRASRSRPASEITAPLVASGAHPRTTVLELVGAEHSPTRSVTDMRRWRSRGGSVKINCVLSEPPRYEGLAEESGRPAARELHAVPVDRLPGARLAGRHPRRARRRALRGGRGAERRRPDR